MLVNTHFQKWPLQFFKNYIYIVNNRNTMFITAVCVIFLSVKSTRSFTLNCVDTLIRRYALETPSLVDTPGPPNENIVQNHFNIALLNLF